jgi:ATP-binding cassette subfamily C protein LapB
MVAQQLITVVMLLWGVHLIDAGQLTGGALIAAVMFAGRALAPLGGVVALASRYQAASAALKSLDQLMSLPTERDASKRYLSRPEIKGQLAMHEVRFAYPQGAHAHAPTVLKGVSIQIQPGERVALLGRIGSGKSTILRLLGGLYQPADGFVEVDGIDLRQIDPADFRAHVGFVTQEPRLFQGTLRDNVLLGRSHADAAQFAEVARLTGLDRIAAAHPMGYDLPVGEAGALLSGGQRQLVALARCLVTRPRVVLMDEPTSSMDAQSEVSFIRHLKHSVEGRTLVVVTHRPALLDVVDRVVVVDGGRILADGPKAEVLAMLAGQKPGVRPAPPVPQSEPEAMAPAPVRAAAGG